MDSSQAFERELTGLLPRLRRFAHALSRNGALDSWLYRIMRNLWIDTVRARGRKEKHEAPEEEALRIGEDPREAIESSLELKRAMVAMEQLPDEQREIVALILIEGFGYREVSEMLDLPIGTVSSRLVRGRNALLATLGGSADD